MVTGISLRTAVACAEMRITASHNKRAALRSLTKIVNGMSSRLSCRIRPAESASKLLAERDAKRVACWEDNLALRLRIEDLELSNAQQAHKIHKLQKMASRLKDFSIQLALVESDLQKTLANIDQGAGHAILVLKELRSTVERHLSSPECLGKDVMPSLMSCIDEASRTIQRICCSVPVSSLHQSFEGRGRNETHTAPDPQKEMAAIKRDTHLQKKHDFRPKPPERACDTHQTQLYVKALELRLSFLEAEIAQLRGQAGPASAVNAYLVLPSSLSLRNENISPAATKTMQGTVLTIVCLFFLMQPGTHIRAQQQNPLSVTSSRTRTPFRLHSPSSHTSGYPSRPGRGDDSRYFKQKLLKRGTGRGCCC
jgi:hypothetical protein